MDGRSRTQARPTVGDEFDDAQSLARLQPSSDGHADDVGGAFRFDDHSGWSFDAVVHGCSDAHTADPGVMDQKPDGALSQVFLGLECGFKSGTHTWVLILCRERLVGDQLRLHDDTHRGVKRLDLVADGHDGPLGKGHQAHR